MTSGAPGLMEYAAPMHGIKGALLACVIENRTPTPMSEDTSPPSVIENRSSLVPVLQVCRANARDRASNTAKDSGDRNSAGGRQAARHVT